MTVTFTTDVTITDDENRTLIPQIECRITCELDGTWHVTDVEILDFDRPGTQYRRLDISDGHINERGIFTMIANEIENDQDAIYEHDDGERYDYGLEAYADVRGHRI